MWAILCCTVLLLGLATMGRAVESPEVEQRVNGRLLVSFKSECDTQVATVRSLGAAVKAAHGELRKKEGKASESAEKLLMEVIETAGEDYRTYSRKVMSFRVRSLSDADDALESLAANVSTSLDNMDNRCTVTRLHLKRVDISIFLLGECPLVAADVAVKELQHDECISFVERDSIVRLYPPFEGLPNTDVLPAKGSDAPEVPVAYWLDNISIHRAWKMQPCSKEIVIGVVDTGVAWKHPDLISNMWVNKNEIPNNGIDDDLNGYVDDVHGYDFVSRKELSDPNGHGTHVAGIIGATPHRTAVQGVCKTVSIAGLRFMDSLGLGATSDAIEAINYAIEMAFDITSNSWGGPEASEGIHQAIKRANAVNQLFVAAAGNSGNSADDRPEYPAAYKVDNIISVAATDEADHLANFSNYGKTSVHIAAPGVHILSTYPPATSKSLSGTSMAAPVVAGVSAMLLSVRHMPVTELKNILFTTADRPRTLKNRVASGGRVSAAYAVCMATKLTQEKDSKSLGSWISMRLKGYLLPRSGTC